MLLEGSLAHYYDQIQATLKELLSARSCDEGEFTPGVDLPLLTLPMREYLSVSTVAYSPVRSYQGKRLALLDLTRNPATMTTKTLASLIIVARAIRFIQDTGQRVSILTPSSANKAIAIRDAVLRAIKAGLVRPDQLNAIVIVPVSSVPKLRNTALSMDSELRARNPVAVYHGTVPGDVKAIAREVMETHREYLEKNGKTNLWYTLQLENYLAADVVRALSEAEFFPPAVDEPRLHVHAVSSAYGLLGHAHGWARFARRDGAQEAPRYFLVQHLGAPDMVLSLYNDGSTDSRHAPRYLYQADSGLFVQHENQRFPSVTFDPEEVLDATFYTRNPPTSSRMNDLIGSQGGGGIVVSLAECLERYGQVRSILIDAGLRLPANPMDIREWSLVMAMVGILNAIDRDLVPEEDILVHGSGSYAVADFNAFPSGELHHVENADSLQALVLNANTY